jgi:hypothetical protein
MLEDYEYTNTIQSFYILILKIYGNVYQHFPRSSMLYEESLRIDLVPQIVKLREIMVSTKKVGKTETNISFSFILCLTAPLNYIIGVKQMY